MRPPSKSTAPARRKIHSILGWAVSASLTHLPYARLSACARGDQTAGPRLRLSSLNWIPVASIARPINPPSASISRTRCPLAVSPISGLQGISATVSAESDTSPTRHPSRDAAQAASHPAWPAPITITSKSHIPLATLGSDLGLTLLWHFGVRHRSDPALALRGQT